MLNIIHSNRMELLIREFSENIRDKKINPLVPEIIVVNNMNIGRWISLEIAKQTGIAANNDFILPAQFIWRIFKLLLPNMADRMELDREIILWRCMEVLPVLIEKDISFNTIKNYLITDYNKEKNNNIDESKLYQLSGLISGIFDKYSMYRHKWLVDWENNYDSLPDKSDDPDVMWQARLWREIAGADFKNHRPGCIQNFFDMYGNIGINETKSFPARAGIFGVSILPPVFFEIFALLSRFMEINLYLLSPCKEYWADIKDEKTITKLNVRNLRRKKPDTNGFYETGNALLASMGKVSRDFLKIIYDSNVAFNENDIYEVPSSDTLLHNIQRDILLLQDVSSNEKQGKIKIADDFTVQIHSCHSRRREIEVFHDQLLRLFETHSDLTPGDILVMAPDIEKYSAYIEAVFGSAPLERQIPWSISDTTLLYSNPLAKVFFQILDLEKSRFKASETLGMLEIKSIQKKFEIEDGYVDKIRKWVNESGIRWGIDGEHRKQAGFHGFEENSWKFGFERMFAGFVMPPEEIFLHDRLTYPYIEGQDAVLLGNLRRFIDVLEEIRQEISKPRTIDEWQSYIMGMIEMIFDPVSEEISCVQDIRNIISKLKNNAQKAKFTGKVSVKIIKNHIKNEISKIPSRGGFLTGRVVFSSLIPMRSIPFRVICLLGMNDEDYPRRDKPQAFDLMERYPNTGDRNRRDEDRQLFLETLLSAGDVFYISYAGNDVNDNSEKNPAVMVSELLDYIEKNFEPDNLAKNIVTRHNLQPFSVNYFKRDKKTFSYKSEWIPKITIDKGKEFINTSLITDISLKKVSLDNLLRFFANPAKFFFNNRLDIYLYDPQEVIPDDESLSISGLAKYKIGDRALKNIIENKIAGQKSDINSLIEYHYKLQTARENVYIIYDNILPEIYEKISVIEHGISNFLPPIDFNLKIGVFELYGSLDNIISESLITCRISDKIRGTDIINLWIKHLILQIVTVDKPDYPKISRHIYIKTSAKGEVSPNHYELREIENADKADEFLEYLLNLYFIGLSTPARFFPETSYEYASVFYKNNNKEKALDKAFRLWTPGLYNQFSESLDKYIQTAFREKEPLNEEFIEISENIFFPVFNYKTEEIENN